MRVRSDYLRPTTSGGQAPKKDHGMNIREAAIVRDATLASHHALWSEGCEAAMIKGQGFAHAAVSSSTTIESLRSRAA